MFLSHEVIKSPLRHPASPTLSPLLSKVSQRNSIYKMTRLVPGTNHQTIVVSTTNTGRRDLNDDLEWQGASLDSHDINIPFLNVRKRAGLVSANLLTCVENLTDLSKISGSITFSHLHSQQQL